MPSEDEHNPVDDTPSAGHETMNAVSKEECPRCGDPNAEVRVGTTDVPNFGVMQIITFLCPKCGYKDTEITEEQSLADKAPEKVTLSISDPSMLSLVIRRGRDAVIAIPEVGMTMNQTERGYITSIEGLLKETLESVERSNDVDRTSDSYREFVDKMKKMIAGEMAFTMEFEDPSGNPLMHEGGAFQ